jgi:hypothetical protein
MSKIDIFWKSLIFWLYCFYQFWKHPVLVVSSFVVAINISQSGQKVMIRGLIMWTLEQ